MKKARSVHESLPSGGVASGSKGNLLRSNTRRPKLSQLLSRLVTDLYDGACPLCGHDYGSADSLLKHVQNRGHDVTAHSRAQLEPSDEERASLESTLKEVQEKEEQERQVFSELTRGRTACEANIAKFEKEATKVGIPIGQPDFMTAKIRDRHRELSAAIESDEHDHAQAQQLVADTNAAIADLDARTADLQDSLARSHADTSAGQSKIEDFRRDPHAERWSLDTDAETLEDLISGYTDRLTDVETRLAHAVNRVTESGLTKAKYDEKLSALSLGLTNVEKDIGARRRAVTETNARLERFGLPESSDASVVEHFLEEEIRATENLEELRNLAESLEVAMDALTTTAVLRRHEKSIRAKERRREELKKELERLNVWRNYFAQLARLVADRQSVAVGHFATKFGPVASTIQQRLRPVYGFQGIETSSHESTIRVRVKHGNEVLRPADYFSQSQQQTLLLGLFLTACTSQSWSSLSSVLMDDPVAHFDDLNLYAFLDMIDGLLDAPVGRRQFIVSTCDKGLFHMARSRLRHLGQNVRFYEFTAIGRDGPAIEEVPPA